MSDEKSNKGILHLTGKTMTIFGTAGFVHGKNWVVNCCEVDPKPARPEAEAVINEDALAGNLDKIAQIRVIPNFALRLFLDGTITPTDVEAAVISENSVTFNDIYFNTAAGRKSFPVLVVPDSSFKVATIDADGSVL